MISNKPKIIHILPWNFTMGGSQRFVRDLSNWASAFAEVHIFCKYHNNFYNVNAQIHDIIDDNEGEELIKEINPDLIHHHYPPGNWLLDTTKKYPHIGTCHKYEDNINIPISEQNWIIPICGNTNKKIIHGIDLDPFLNLKKYNNSNKIIVSIIGRRSKEKIPQSFISYLQSNTLSDNIFLKIIGKGNHYFDNGISESLSKIKNVELIGNLSSRDLLEQYAQTDIVLIPSITESCSYVALEAMSSSIPIVYRKTGALPDIIKDAGLSGDTDEELFKQIKKLASNKKLREKIGKTGRKLAKKDYDIKRMFREYNEVYRRVTGGLVRQPKEGVDCSVILPIYNTNPKFLQQSLKSVLNQKGVNFEIIAINDGSTNKETIKTLNKYKNRINIINKRKNEVLGCGPALNVGILAANSDLIIRHDSDDIMLPQRLKIQVDFHKQNPDTYMTAGQIHVIDKNGKLHKDWEGSNFKTYSQKPYWLQNWNDNGIAHPTVAYYRHIILKLGGYKEGLAQDLDLWSRMWLANIKTVILPYYLTKYRYFSVEQESRSKELLEESNKLIEKYNNIWNNIRQQCKIFHPFIKRFYNNEETFKEG